MPDSPRIEGRKPIIEFLNGYIQMPMHNLDSAWKKVRRLKKKKGLPYEPHPLNGKPCISVEKFNEWWETFWKT